MTWPSLDGGESVTETDQEPTFAPRSMTWQWGDHPRPFPEGDPWPSSPWAGVEDHDG